MTPFEQQVSKVLRNVWDPIGLCKMPDLPQDEYDDYAAGVVTILSSDNTEEMKVALVSSYLTRIRTVIICLRDENCERDAKAALALVHMEQLEP